MIDWLIGYCFKTTGHSARSHFILQNPFKRVQGLDRAQSNATGWAFVACRSEKAARQFPLQSARLSLCHHVLQQRLEIFRGLLFARRRGRGRFETLFRAGSNSLDELGFGQLQGNLATLICSTANHFGITFSHFRWTNWERRWVRWTDCW